MKLNNSIKIAIQQFGGLHVYSLDRSRDLRSFSTLQIRDRMSLPSAGGVNLSKWLLCVKVFLAARKFLKVLLLPKSSIESWTSAQGVR